MKISGKNLRLAIVLAASLLTGGCGGFSGSHSVSPASFFLPGLMQNTPCPAPVPSEEPDQEAPAIVARAS